MRIWTVVCYFCVLLHKMLKTTLLLLLLSACLSTVSGQPKEHRDSLIRAARNEAKNFRLDDIIWKKYRRQPPYTSDYFKPRENNVKNTTLLSDSVFVMAYRKAAFKRNRHRRTAGHYVLVGLGTAAGLFVAGLVAIVIMVGPTMN